MDIETLGATEHHIALILRLRRARSCALGEGLFGDVGWDILLELFAARLGRRRVKLSELDIAAPQSTIARWAAVLEQRGLIACQQDAPGCNDRWAELTSVGTAKMAELFRMLDFQRPAR